MIWFTSDTHFRHAGILRHCSRSRPYSSVEEMDAALIANWNAAVQPDDRIYHLGDVSLSKDRLALGQIFGRLNGVKYLVPGNHDVWLKHPALDEYWAVLPPLYETSIEGQDLVLCHFPLLSWKQAHRGAWMLHGHCHGNLDALNATTTRLDVGVDSHGCRPISYPEIKAIMAQRTYTPVDHHLAR